MSLFMSLKDAFPNLQMSLSSEPPNVEAILKVPEQEGMPFALCFYTYGDELHITAGEKFWLEWFPDNKPEVVERYREAALGLLSGRYRIVEYRRKTRVVKAHLQRPEGSGWQTIGGWGLPLPFIWPKRSMTVLQREAQ